MEVSQGTEKVKNADRRISIHVNIQLASTLKILKPTRRSSGLWAGRQEGNRFEASLSNSATHCLQIKSKKD